MNSPEKMFESECEVARLLLERGCLKVNPKHPFTYASGLRGPMYCDNRKILAFVEERRKIIEAFVQMIKSEKLQFDAICGLATAGIPHGALIADKLGCPFIYARSKPKGHGKRNQIEGHFNPGDKVLVIEDLINQGKSLEDAVLGIMEADLRPIACCSIVHYQMEQAEERSNKLNIPLYSLTNFEAILETAVRLNKIDQSEKSLLTAWQKDPQKWSENFSGEERT